ncbi:hypothetical protein [Thalassobellus suaedae]|uniref:Uncharacterized protein n=1 Tax=Thalassobellus suaedae TaxID=3074124 RepID=A0ABY9XR43_9FLAO|nr:hypothetical protein RHP51_14785 [Flavobacteriaceae bacterium HL-DH14]
MTIYDSQAKPYLIGNTVHGYLNKFDGFETSENLSDARDKTISYAVPIDYYNIVLEIHQNMMKYSKFLMI